MSARNKKQSGQTLIETIVAIFILTTGLITAIGLAIYTFQGSDVASKQIVATALAREGIEVVKNTRDTNWLTQSLVDCSSDIGAGQKCYKQWLQGLNEGDYVVNYNSSSNKWSLGPPTPNFALNYDPSNGLYTTSGNGNTNPTVYSRKITLTYDKTTPPFTNKNPMLIVTSTVWWKGRKCPAASDPAMVSPGCKVILEMHLTNWRNY